MSKRAWRKFKDEKARRKAERKADIKRANAPTSGRMTGPAGFPLLEVRCPECDYPTTEVYAMKSGGSACPRCSPDASECLFAIVREVRGDDVLAHTVTPHQPTVSAS